jgi:hypothetical protein
MQTIVFIYPFESSLVVVSKMNMQGNMYDKIFRENMEAALPGIIENLLGLKMNGALDQITW